MKRGIDMRREKGQRDERRDENRDEWRRKERKSGERKSRLLFDIEEALLETPHKSSLLSNVLKMC